MPRDGSTTLATQVSVTGTVTPGTASVLVVGRSVATQRGSFTVRVPLRAGTNVLDVLAGAPGEQAAMTAVRVYREIAVAVPPLGGQDPTAAAQRLQLLGLRPQVENVGGFFEVLIPSSAQVCSTSPSAGARLAPGSQVKLEVAKLC